MRKTPLQSYSDQSLLDGIGTNIGCIVAVTELWEELFLGIYLRGGLAKIWRKASVSW